MAALTLLFLLLPAAARAAEEVCPGLVLEDGRVTLTEGERRLACGDEESEGWRNVPRAQVRRLLTAFLQKRAYYFPVFTERGADLVVEPGPRTRISRLTGTGLPPGLDLAKRRDTVGAPMTPAMLDSISASVRADLQNRGRACPAVELSADAGTGEVKVAVSTGPPDLVADIEEPRLPGIDPGIYRRFEAFQRGKPLDQRLLTLTSDRIVSQALFLNSAYDVSCGTGGARVVHRVVAAPPRLVRVGAGVDTEGYGHLRVQWQHSRIGARASTAETTLLASAREQSLEASMHFFASPSSRYSLLPQAVVSRSDEPDYETRLAQVSLMPSAAWDDQRMHLDFRAGPAFAYVETVRGLGPGGSNFLAFNARAELTSHLYEYFLREPQRGFRAGLDTASRVAGIDSSLTAHRVRFSTEKLWNLGGYDPPLLVLGERDWIGTTWARDYRAAVVALPPESRFFIGGDADYRGVAREKLPGDARGFFTGAYQGLELRAPDLLPLRLQPFAFLDGAMGSRTAFHLDRDVYYAPGFGVRWASPAGAFRALAARSLFWHRAEGTPDRPPRWQYFVSYGREF